MRKIWIALLVIAPCLFAHGDEKNCKEVSGGIVTNFLTESGTVNFPTRAINNLYLLLWAPLLVILQEGLAFTSSASRRVIPPSQMCTIIG
jgi:hypothetical protein